MRTTDELALELLGLPAKTRAVLAEKLIASLEEEAGSDVESLWVQEAERRRKQADQGTVILKPLEAVIADARARLPR